MPTDPNLVKLIWIFTAVLLPVIPSYILFKSLPSSKANVAGPFKGFKINLSGSIAAYIILFAAVLFGFHPTPPDEVWTVKGWVQDDKGGSLPPDKVNMNIQPRSVEYRNDGSFEMDILVKRNQSGQLKLPTLNVDWQPVQAFGNATVHLDAAEQRFGTKYKISVNEGSREVRIEDPIKLEKKIVETAYAPTSAAPLPTVLPAKLADPSPTSAPKPTP